MCAAPAEPLVSVVMGWAKASRRPLRCLHYCDLLPSPLLQGLGVSPATLGMGGYYVWGVTVTSLVVLLLLALHVLQEEMLALVHQLDRPQHLRAAPGGT